MISFDLNGLANITSWFPSIWRVAIKIIGWLWKVASFARLRFGSFDVHSWAIVTYDERSKVYLRVIIVCSYSVCLTKGQTCSDRSLGPVYQGLKSINTGYQLNSMYSKHCERVTPVIDEVEESVHVFMCTCMLAFWANWKVQRGYIADRINFYADFKRRLVSFCPLVTRARKDTCRSAGLY